MCLTANCTRLIIARYQISIARIAERRNVSSLVFFSVCMRAAITVSRIHAATRRGFHAISVRSCIIVVRCAAFL